MSALVKHTLVCLLFACAVGLGGCASVQQQVPLADPPQLELPSDRFGPEPPALEPHEIFRLTSEQSRDFLNYLHDPWRASIPAHERVSDYLQFATTDFNYHGDTLAAATTLERGSGNCLSLAILTTALADLAGVEIDYQLMDSAPVFESRGEVISKGVHARSILYDPAWRPEEKMLVFRRPGIQVDYFPSGAERFIGNLSRQEFVSMYYSNLAADAVAGNDLSAAYWLARKSLQSDPESTAALNTLAVVYRRSGDWATAEALYRHGIDHFRDKVSLLRNYRILLAEQGRSEEASEISRQLDRLAEPNPFDWIHAAQAAHDEGQYREALALYRRAVAIAPYLHESYFGMARSHFELGNVRQAEANLANAIERANRSSTRFLYKAKLLNLRSTESGG